MTNLADGEVEAAVVAAYKRGERLVDIEKEFDVARATIYWFLQRAGIEPDRAKSSARLRGNDRDLALLYEVIDAQDKRIQALTDALRGLLDGHGSEAALRALEGDE